MLFRAAITNLNDALNALGIAQGARMVVVPSDTEELEGRLRSEGVDVSYVPYDPAVGEVQRAAKVGDVTIIWSLR